MRGVKVRGKNNRGDYKQEDVAGYEMTKRKKKTERDDHQRTLSERGQTHQGKLCSLREAELRCVVRLPLSLLFYLSLYVSPRGEGQSAANAL